VLVLTLALLEWLGGLLEWLGALLLLFVAVAANNIGASNRAANTGFMVRNPILPAADNSGGQRRSCPPCFRQQVILRFHGVATQTKSLLSLGRRASPDTRRIPELAEQAALFQAQRWFARERAWINDQHLALCRVPAPTFFEEKRARWFTEQLRSLRWEATLDRAGNVLATFPGSAGQPLLAVTAHLDTVLSPNRPEDITVSPDGRFHGPGVSDNGSGLASLLALARVLAETPGLQELARSVLIVANVGEEGEGNLSGMRYLCRQSTWAERIRAFIVLDGPALDHITAQALSSRRFEITFHGSGGHSWNDQGNANPVHAAGHAISTFVQEAESRAGGASARFAYNFGIIEGGASINSIPAKALTKLDLRSEDPDALQELASLLTTSVEKALELENHRARASRITAKIKELGWRPGGKLAPDSLLLRTVQAVDAHLQIRARVNCASTDANLPLSLGLPALSIGAGGQGAGAHTEQEWFHPDGRELGLRRVLLLLAALATDPGRDLAAEDSDV
jgi:acetylornithine deacetylase/succinyl-diaminopimelate desuccinylase-like protein